MSQIWVPGPAYIQVGTGAAGALQHLGWSEEGVTIRTNAEYEDVLCDLGGSKIGSDAQYLGEDAMISFSAVRYNETVLQAVLARLQNKSTGVIGAGDIGSLMIGEGRAYRLLIGCPYAAKSAFTGMVSAWNFLSTYLVGEADTSLGTKVKKWNLTFRAIPNYIVSGGVVSATLFNSSTTGAATLD